MQDANATSRKADVQHKTNAANTKQLQSREYLDILLSYISHLLQGYLITILYLPRRDPTPSSTSNNRQHPK